MSRVWVAIKRFGRVLKFLFVCLILTICIFLVWRMFSTGTPDSIKTLLPTDELREAYGLNADGPYIFKQSYDEITTAERNYGYFALPDAVFMPEINQAQVVFRYNNSTVRALAEDYGLDPVPDREQDLFDVSLVLYIDITPEDDSDNDDVNSAGFKKIRFNPIAQKSERTQLHSFYRYAFDFDEGEEAVDIQSLIDDGTLVSVHAEFYYKGDVDYEKTAYGALSIYYYQYSNREVALTSKDKKALAE